MRYMGTIEITKFCKEKEQKLLGKYLGTSSRRLLLRGLRR